MLCFISYSHADRYFALLLEEKLSSMTDIEIWRDDSSIRGGDEWRSSIDQGIKDCDCFILVLSQSSFESKYVTYEMGYAFGLSKTVLPLWLEKCDRHPKVEPVQYLDFRKPTGESWERLEQRLRSVVAESEPPEIGQVGEEKVQNFPGVGSGSLSQKEREVRDGILAYLDARGFRAMSFDRVRDRVYTEWSDEDLRKLVSKVDDFAIARLKGGKDGLRLL